MGSLANGFVSHNKHFRDLLGDSPSLELLAEKDYPFAHEAAVFIPSTNELFITSNRLEDKKGTPYVSINKVSIRGSADETTCEVIPWTGGYGDGSADGENSIYMANGGVNYGDDKILFCAQGHTQQPSGIYSMTMAPPYTRERIITDFYGRPFNSVNDLVVARADGCVWFTDPSYGAEQGYRPKPSLPDQVYRYDPSSGSIRVVADGFVHPNGLCFSPDEKVMYITDTGKVHGSGVIDDQKPATMWVWHRP
jgi:gluconolactonase